MKTRKTRLKLDWTLDSTEDRLEHIQNLDLSQYSSDDLETISNYILWSVEYNTDEKFHIKRSKSDWEEKDDKLESLEGLIELPGFNETTLRSLQEPAPKIRREVFDRERALSQCPDWLQHQLIQLFMDIDKTDYIVSAWELAHGKRTKPIREELLDRLGANLRDSLDAEAQELTQYMYLKKKHLLRSLRSQQYTLKDSYSSAIYRHTTPPPSHETYRPTYRVLPAGLYDKNKLIFSRDIGIMAKNGEIEEEELNKILREYWYIQKQSIDSFDFRRAEDIYQLFLLYYDVEDEGEKRKELLSFDTELLDLLKTLKFYIAAADLTDVQRDILDMKTNKKLNQDIKDFVNQKYGTSYTTNYISTIFKQKIIKKINEAAEQHARVIENLCYPENWKVCKCCGKTLLLDADFFVRRARSKDGFAAQCKICDREARIRRK